MATRTTLTPIPPVAIILEMRWPIVVVALLVTASSARADKAPNELPKDRVGFDAMFVLPVDTYGDDADGGIGGLVRYERRMGSKLYLNARGGPLFHAASVDGQGLFMLLALVGMRYNLDPDQASGTFFSMAIGMNYVRISAEGMGVKASDAEPELTLDIGGGFQVSRVQVRGSIFYTPHVGASFGGDSVSYLGMAVTIGYDFVVR